MAQPEPVPEPEPEPYAIVAMIKVADNLASLDALRPAPLTLPCARLSVRQHPFDRVQNAVEAPPHPPFPCARHPASGLWSRPRPGRSTARWT